MLNIVSGQMLCEAGHRQAGHCSQASHSPLSQAPTRRAAARGADFALDSPAPSPLSQAPTRRAAARGADFALDSPAPSLLALLAMPRLPKDLGCRGLCEQQLHPPNPAINRRKEIKDVVRIKEISENAAIFINTVLH